MFKILVVEDDRELNRAVCAFLGRNGYEAVGCLCAEEAYDALYETVFDLIISDIMMPGTDGFEFARTVREQNTELPILFMTARDDLTAKQRGFSAGADDYMVKPVDLDELLLRIGALLRRAKIASSKRLTAGSLLLDADEHTAYLSGAEVPLTGIRPAVQAALLPEKDLHPRTAYGGILGNGNILRPAHCGCIYHQAAGQIFRLPGF